MSTFVWVPSSGTVTTGSRIIGVWTRFWSLTFANRSNADADAIEAFLKSNAAGFDWTPPRGGGGHVAVC